MSPIRIVEDAAGPQKPCAPPAPGARRSVPLLPNPIAGAFGADPERSAPADARPRHREIADPARGRLACPGIPRRALGDASGRHGPPRSPASARGRGLSGDRGARSGGEQARSAAPVRPRRSGGGQVGPERGASTAGTGRAHGCDRSRRLDPRPDPRRRGAPSGRGPGLRRPHSRGRLAAPGRRGPIRHRPPRRLDLHRLRPRPGRAALEPPDPAAIAAPSRDPAIEHPPEIVRGPEVRDRALIGTPAGSGTGTRVDGKLRPGPRSS